MRNEKREAVSRIAKRRFSPRERPFLSPRKAVLLYEGAEQLTCTDFGGSSAI